MKGKILIEEAVNLIMDQESQPIFKEEGTIAEIKGQEAEPSELAGIIKL